ncbi:acetyl-CoA carboxylase biotin carboxylase subunit [Notoacmeibacter ruber]|uniref:propionyl-CoA carboxylase n=1 Tax=Notoacmeibacter ruber TaxID=2670375 RepID=A0A3L7JI02_9HYPH|nr:acetyl/propionyl/methylcrotonyl-CoA carboxylase subunit alpha [Notoacmeibacter ruber]RLQ89251.1 acetyl/propionyl/methylcrotonyl-CoA carboxylase subunit alpha [Notoacmeibacter ruber]
MSNKPFTKILIANRGEIACRVIKTAKKMGIATVAVYSDADKDAVHVRMADEAVHIGPPQANQSYLVADKIIEACRKTGAQAVHPGYGFLSENAKFCETLEAAGITFIGPKPKAIEAMGDKITSKKLAQEAGVSTVPGHMGLIADAEEAAKISAEIGYPVMIKASAGGGGKGMRIAWNDEEAREGFERSKSEAASSFGDDRIFIEKFVEQPRHIEIQVLADSHGNTLYLNERECSIQRRNQKVIEEAPSPFLDEETRKAMGEQSVALAKAVDYESAGTVEFIVDKDRNFYFLEMNTRLQVEHPVTELITGVDLVEQMIRVAAGEKLALTQDDIGIDGWAIESRLYAEDPYRNFLPSIGRLTAYAPPAEGPVGERSEGDPVAEGPGGSAIGGGTPIIRNDTGVTDGSEISMFYDPMVAKLCTWAPTRDEATEAMADALDAFVVDGIGHNIPFLSAIMAHPKWKSGDISTKFIEEEYPEGFEGAAPGENDLRDLAVAAALLKRLSAREPLGATTGSNLHVGGTPTNLSVFIGDERMAVEAIPAAGGFNVTVNGEALGMVEIDWRRGQTLARLTIEGDTLTMRVNPVTAGYRLRHAGMDLVAKVYSPHVAELAALMPVKEAPDTSNLLLCPMPGLVVSLMVNKGEKVEEGQALAIIEAMKMENVLRAERQATVKRLAVEEGDSLAVDETIMEFETSA